MSKHLSGTHHEHLPEPEPQEEEGTYVIRCDTCNMIVDRIPWTQPSAWRFAHLAVLAHERLQRSPHKVYIEKQVEILQ